MENESSARWIKEPKKIAFQRPMSMYSSFVYRSRRPFHPDRFWDFCMLNEWVITSKGFFWLATRYTYCQLSQLKGGSAEHNLVVFVGATQTYWPEDEEMKKSIMKQWVEPHGDRRQEIVYSHRIYQK